MPYKAAHQNPSGPGDARPTALDVVKDEGMVGGLAGKTILITGATSGIGLETARAMYSTGAKVFITGRQVDKGIEVAKSISTDSGPAVEMIGIELDSFESIRAGAAEFLKKANGLNVLICNAGVMMCPEARTKDGYEYQLGVNYLSHFLLFQLLKDTLINSSSPKSASRVVILSSCAHRNGPVMIGDYNFEKTPYDAGAAYGQAKTADLYLANEIDRRYSAQGIHSNSVHPGFIHTPLLRHIIDDPSAKDFIGTPEAKKVWKSPEQGAATTIWAAVGKEWESRGGRYLEECSEGEAFDKEHAWHPGYASGYAKYAYDEKAAKQLWEDSLAMIG